MSNFGKINYEAYGIQQRFVGFDIADYAVATQEQHNVLMAVKQYHDNLVEKYKAGEGIVFVGNTGTGKTQLSSCIIKNAIDMANGGSRLVTEFDLLADIARADNYANNVTVKEIVEKYIDYKFLAIDDIGVIGAGQLKDEQKARLYAVINGRYAAKKPTIASSNFDEKVLAKHLGARIFDRLTTRTNSPILVFNWSSHTKGAA